MAEFYIMKKLRYSGQQFDESTNEHMKWNLLNGDQTALVILSRGWFALMLCNESSSIIVKG